MKKPAQRGLADTKSRSLVSDPSSLYNLLVLSCPHNLEKILPISLSRVDIYWRPAVESD